MRRSSRWPYSVRKTERTVHCRRARWGLLLSIYVCVVVTKLGWCVAILLQTWCRSGYVDKTQVLGSFRSIAPGGSISKEEFREKMTLWGDEPLSEDEVSTVSACNFGKFVLTLTACLSGRRLFARCSAHRRWGHRLRGGSATATRGYPQKGKSGLEQSEAEGSVRQR